MSDTTVSLLTPVGVGAIATIEVTGPQAWSQARQLFRPAGKPLPDFPELHRFWFGTLGEGAGDEVILAVTGPQSVEIHCHGGRRVVQWIMDQFLLSGGRQSPESAHSNSLRGLTPPARLLPFAPTLRTASILLDQLHGAFDNAVRHILALIDSDVKAALKSLRELSEFAPVGQHLIEPWKVVIAGPPNVGKSSLVNALAGYQRAVVSEIAGTTRDVVSVQLAFDGWPIELTDTAGLRDAEGLEAEGIECAKRVLAEADLVLWIVDASETPVADAPGSPGLVVWNKADLSDEVLPGLSVSAKTGQGIPELVAEVVRRLVPAVPSPGVAVPFTPHLADRVAAAQAALAANQHAEASRLLRACLPHD